MSPFQLAISYDSHLFWLVTAEIQLPDPGSTWPLCWSSERQTSAELTAQAWDKL